MYGSCFFNTFAFLLFTYECIAIYNGTHKIKSFEFGNHVLGEELAFTDKGIIPPFVPLYTLNVTHSNTELERQYTYLRVEYLSPLSSVDIVFEPETSILTFHIVFPFLNIPYGVIGISVKLGTLEEKPNATTYDESY